MLAKGISLDESFRLMICSDKSSFGDVLLHLAQLTCPRFNEERKKCGAITWPLLLPFVVKEHEMRYLLCLPAFSKHLTVVSASTNDSGSACDTWSERHSQFLILLLPSPWRQLFCIFVASSPSRKVNRCNLAPVTLTKHPCATYRTP